MKKSRHDYDLFSKNLEKVFADMDGKHIARLEAHGHPDYRKSTERFAWALFRVSNGYVFSDMISHYIEDLHNGEVAVEITHEYDSERARCRLTIIPRKDLPKDFAEEETKKALSCFSRTYHNYISTHKAKP